MYPNQPDHPPLRPLQDNLPSALVNSDHKIADLMALVCIFLQEMVQVGGE